MSTPVPTSASAIDRHSQARLAGLLYVLVVILGVFALGRAPETAFAGETDAERLASVSANVDLVGLIVVAEIACYVAFAALAVALQRLFKPVDQFAAALLATFALISVPFGFANTGHLLEIIRAVEADASPMTTHVVAAALARYRGGLLVQSVPWGLWLLPFGWLVIRCRFLPKVIGFGLVLAGLGYVVHFVARLLVDGYRESIWPNVLGAPRISEMAIAAWLLMFGARSAPWRRPSIATVSIATTDNENPQ